MNNEMTADNIHHEVLYIFVQIQYGFRLQCYALKKKESLDLVLPLSHFPRPETLLADLASFPSQTSSILLAKRLIEDSFISGMRMLLGEKASHHLDRFVYLFTQLYYLVCTQLLVW